jgi:hypothetical protein
MVGLLSPRSMELTKVRLDTTVMSSCDFAARCRAKRSARPTLVFEGICSSVKPPFASFDFYRATIYSVQMFITYPEFEGFLPKFAGYENCKRWEIFELAADLPYYMVEMVQSAKTKEEHHLSFIVASVHLVEQMLNKDDALRKVVQLHMVRPGSYNGTASWSVEKVLRMRRGVAHLQGKPYPVYLFDLHRTGTVVEPPVDDARQVDPGELMFEFAPTRGAGRHD